MKFTAKVDFENYRKLTFNLAHRNWRYLGISIIGTYWIIMSSLVLLGIIPGSGEQRLFFNTNKWFKRAGAKIFA